MTSKMFESRDSSPGVVEDATRPQDDVCPSNSTIRVYKYRWVVLTLFSLVCMTNGFQWIQYSIISNIIQKYYGISAFAVDWFSMIAMALYIVFIFPSLWLQDYMSLRMTVILGALGNFLGAWIKVFSVSPDLFAVSFVGQSISALAQVFLLNLPTKVAAVWFGPDQVSSACAIAVFGNQLGVALGFLLPPVIVQNQEDLTEIGLDLATMFYSVAGICTVLQILVFFCFKAEPPLPPSIAQAAQRTNQNKGIFKCMRRLFSNMGFVLTVLSYSINIGIFNAFATLLNKMVLEFYPDGGEDAGRIGLTMILTGMVGSVLSGVFLDKTHRYKETMIGLYVLSLLSMLAFTFTLSCGYIAVVYVVCGLLGFFMTGYMLVGYEFAVELTYPEPEGMTTAILVASNQLAGVLLTMFYSWLLREAGDKWANLVVCAVLAIGCVITVVTKKDYRRQAQSSKEL